MYIDDGMFGTNQKVGVTKDGRAAVDSRSVSGSAVAALSGKSYKWTSSYSASTGDPVIYLKNTSETNYLVIGGIICGCVNTGLFELKVVTGTAGGTGITGRPTNLAISGAAAASAYGDAAVTGLSASNRLGLVRCPANSSTWIPGNDSFVLAPSSAVAVYYTGTSGAAVDVDITGYFTSPSNQ